MLHTKLHEYRIGNPVYTAKKKNEKYNPHFVLKTFWEHQNDNVDIPSGGGNFQRICEVENNILDICYDLESTMGTSTTR